jgi:hypothetical protein
MSIKTPIMYEDIELYSLVLFQTNTTRRGSRKVLAVAYLFDHLLPQSEWSNVLVRSMGFPCIKRAWKEKWVKHQSHLPAHHSSPTGAYTSPLHYFFVNRDSSTLRN